MKKSKIKMISILMAIILLLGVTLIGTKSYATEVENTLLTTGENESEGEEAGEILTGILPETPQIYENDLFVFFGEDEISPDNYVMDKLVDGNVFIMGKDVKVTGQINGSLYVVASKLTIEDGAYIAMDLYACAQEIIYSGYAFDIYAISDAFTMTKTGIAYRDLKLVANDAKLYGSIGRNVELGAKNISIVDPDVVVEEGVETAEGRLFVGNDFKYSSANKISEEELSKVTITNDTIFEEEVDDGEKVDPTEIIDVNDIKEEVKKESEINNEMIIIIILSCIVLALTIVIIIKLVNIKKKEK